MCTSKVLICVVDSLVKGSSIWRTSSSSLGVIALISSFSFPYMYGIIHPGLQLRYCDHVDVVKYIEAVLDNACPLLDQVRSPSSLLSLHSSQVKLVLTILLCHNDLSDLFMLTPFSSCVMHRTSLIAFCSVLSILQATA